jgi:hypothetical protein
VIAKGIRGGKLNIESLQVLSALYAVSVERLVKQTLA